MSATCATDGCERDVCNGGYCGRCYIAEIQLDTCGARSDHDPENPPKCWACLDRPARIGFDKCMTCSECWLGCGRKPMSGKDLCREHRERSKEKSRERMRDRWANDPEYRERRRDPEVRKRRLERDRDRWANDPEYRERKLEQNRERRRDPEVRKRREEWRRERYATDPEYRERKLERRRERRIAAKKPRPCRADGCDAIIPPEARADKLYCTTACRDRHRLKRDRERYAAKKLNNSNTEHLTC